MEEKTTEWILSLLAYRGEQVPILDTVIIKDKKALKLVYNDVRDIVRVKEAKPVAAFLQSLVNLRINPSSIICCLVKGTRRRFVSKVDLRSILAKKLPTIDQVQLCGGLNSIQIVPTYNFVIYFTEQNYKSSLYAKDSLQCKRIKNVFTSNYAKEVAYIIIKAIECEESKRVLKLEIEFVKDSNGKIFLHQINECKVVSLQKLNSSIENLRDLNYFIGQFKGIKSKQVFEKSSYVESELNYSRISIESEASEEEVVIQRKKSSRKPSSKFCQQTTRKSVEISSQRASSIKEERAMFTRRALRSSVMLTGTTDGRSFMKDDEEEDIDDLYSFGEYNSHFLELLTRQLMKESKPLRRPISPDVKELKEKIREVYNTISSPIGEKIFDYHSKEFPIIKITSDPLISPNPSFPPLQQRSFDNRKFNSKSQIFPVTKAVLSDRKPSQYKLF